MTSKIIYKVYVKYNIIDIKIHLNFLVKLSNIKWRIQIFSMVMILTEEKALYEFGCVTMKYLQKIELMSLRNTKIKNFSLITYFKT